MRRAGGRERRREFGDARAACGRDRDLILGRVVVAGEDRAEPAGAGDDGRRVPRPHPRSEGLEPGHVRDELRVVQSVPALDEAAHPVDVAELALTGRVVHHADDADPIPVAEFGEFVLKRLRAYLGAQVQAVPDAQQAGADQRADLGGHAARIGAVIGAAGNPHRADPQRVEHRGHAAAGELGVMGDDGRRARPVDAGSRLKMSLQVVGVQLDQTGGEQIAIQIHRARRPRAAAVIDRGDQAVADHQRAAPELGLEHERRVRKNGLVGLRGAGGPCHGRVMPPGGTGCKRIGVTRPMSRRARTRNWRSARRPGSAGTRRPARCAKASISRGFRSRANRWSRRQPDMAFTAR